MGPVDTVGTLQQMSMGRTGHLFVAVMEDGPGKLVTTLVSCYYYK